MRIGTEGRYMAAAGTVAAALFVAGCGWGGSGEAPPQSGSAGPAPAEESADRIVCHPIEAAAWVPTPSWIRRISVARHLGVTFSQVVNGQTGPARCETPISSLLVGRDKGVPVTIPEAGDGGNCLAIALDSGSNPADPEHAYSGILAVCAAPPEGFGRTI